MQNESKNRDYFKKDAQDVQYYFRDGDESLDSLQDVQF